MARYAEKEAARASEVAATVVSSPVQTSTYMEAVPSYATVSRRETKPKGHKTDRSRSRAVLRNKKIKETKQEEHMPSFVIKECSGTTTKDVREMIWNQVISKKIRPKCQTVTTKAGKVILRLRIRRRRMFLKHLTRVSPSLLQEDSPRWPRIIFRGLSTDSNLGEDTQRVILEQNPELGINSNVDEVVLKPIFKCGPRDRGQTNWVVEVNPKYYDKFEDTTIYMGFMRCRVNAYEEITQCHMCLRFGHPAAKCFEKECVCAHCGRKGHKAADCPAAKTDQHARIVRANTMPETRRVPRGRHLC